MQLMSTVPEVSTKKWYHRTATSESKSQLVILTVTALTGSDIFCPNESFLSND